MKISDVRFVKSIVKLDHEISPLKAISEKPQIFFLGRSNVGKSSMINSLFGKKGLARSSAQAGKTNTINLYEVNGSYECYDFPGYGYARGGKENMEHLRDMILDYVHQNLNSRVRTVVIIDAFVGPTQFDEEILGYLYERKARILIVANKADKTNQKELEATRLKLTRLFPEIPYILYSCHDKKYQDGALETIFENL